MKTFRKAAQHSAASLNFVARSSGRSRRFAPLKHIAARREPGTVIAPLEPHHIVQPTPATHAILIIEGRGTVFQAL